MIAIIIVGYIVAVLLTYKVNRRIIKCASKREDIDYYCWSSFWANAVASVIIPIIAIIPCYMAYGRFPKVKFPKLL